MQNILELQCLVDDLGDVLELLMFINFFTLNVLFNEVMKGIGDSGMEKNILLATIYIFFFFFFFIMN